MYQEAPKHNRYSTGYIESNYYISQIKTYRLRDKTSNCLISIINVMFRIAEIIREKPKVLNPNLSYSQSHE